MSTEPGKTGGEGDGEQKGMFADVEATARRMGWKPEEEYRGPKDKWRPAEDFVNEAMSNYPVLMDRYRVLDERAGRTQRDLEAANGRLVDIGKAVTEMRDFQAQSLKAAEIRAYNQARADIEEEIRQATKDADPQKANAALQKLKALDEKRPTPEPEPAKKPDAAAAGGAAAAGTAGAADGSTAPKIQPEVVEWVKNNDWFNTNDEANALAVTFHRKLLATRKDLSLAENLEMVTAEVRKRYPELFDDPPPTRKANGAGDDDAGGESTKRGAAAVTESSVGSAAGGGGGGGGAGKRTYANLPADAKAACDRFVKTMIKGPDGKEKPMMTRDEYVAQYPWES